MLKKVAFLTMLCGGCVVHETNPPPPVGPPVYHIDPGASTVVFPGSQAGYGITANLGGSYRAVWTGESPVRYNNFRGTIFTPGTFTFIDPGCGGVCPVESSDLFQTGPVAGGGEQIIFDTVATTGLDGVDFVVDAEPVEFDLKIDGGRYPDLVFFPSGGAIVSPETMPFDLTTR
jgi:hypothetical protein